GELRLLQNLPEAVEIDPQTYYAGKLPFLVPDRIAEMEGRPGGTPADGVLARGEFAGGHGIFEVAPVGDGERCAADTGNPGVTGSVRDEDVGVAGILLEEAAQDGPHAGGVASPDFRQLGQG